MSYVYMQSPETGHVFYTSRPDFHTQHVKMTAKAGKAAYVAQCRANLLDSIKPNDTVYTILRDVSSSGMQRRIDVMIIDGGRPRIISGYVAELLGYQWGTNNKPGIVIKGCGQDMGYAIVHSLGRALWPNGTDKPHGRRNGEPDSDGGYALRHEWL